MANKYVTMKDADSINAVNDGNEINMLATELVWNFGTFTPAAQVPSKSTTASWNYRLADTDYVGHMNPKLTLQGTIPAGGEIAGPTTPTWLTFKILWEMGKSGHEFILYDNKIIDPLVTSTPVGEPYPPYQSDGGMRVRIVDISVTRSLGATTVTSSNKVDRGYLLTYSMSLVEVKNPNL